MKHLIYFPSYVPAPVVGNWIYVIAYAYEQSFHSAGKVVRTGSGEFNKETYVEYKQLKLQRFSDRPLVNS